MAGWEVGGGLRIMTAACFPVNLGVVWLQVLSSLTFLRNTRLSPPRCKSLQVATKGETGPEGERVFISQK